MYQHHTLTLCTFIPPLNTLGLPHYVGESEQSWRKILTAFRAVRQAASADDYDVVHVHMPFLGLLLAIIWLFRPAKRRRVVYTVHNSYQSFKWRYRIIKLFLFWAFGPIVACSQSAATSFPPIYQRIAGKRFMAIPNGVNLARVDATPAAPSDQPNRLIFISVGRLIPIKNPMTVYEAFRDAQIEGATLYFIGQGGLDAPLQQAIEADGMADRVQLTGNIPREDVYRWMKRATGLLSASYGEGLPYSIMEAMACACPVIVSDIPPHRELLATMDEVQPIEPDDKAVFQAAIQHLAQMTPDERQALGQRYRETVEQYFSMRVMSEKYNQLYHKIAGRVAPQNSIAGV